MLAVAYIDKIGSSRKTKLCPANWRRVLLSALLLSEKVYEDQAVWNIDYAKSFPEISVDDLRQLEREFLIKIQFELTLKPSEYAKYYFELVSRRDKNEYPLHQLDRNTATTLEAKAIGCVKKAKLAYRLHGTRNRFYSQSTLHRPGPRICFEELQKIRSDLLN